MCTDRSKFYEEVHDLERKYAVLYQPLFDKVMLSNTLPKIQEDNKALEI